jgi:hypothetical protein
LIRGELFFLCSSSPNWLSFEMMDTEILTSSPGLLPLYGAKSFLSTPSVASIVARQVGGSTPLGSPLPATHLPLPVRFIHPHLLHLNLIISTGHDSTVTIVYPGGPAIYTVRLTTLPIVTLSWTSEESLVGAGHDCQPLVFSGSADAGWQLVGTLDDPQTNKASGGASRSGFGGAPSPVGRLQSSAFNTFRNADSRGIGSVPGSPVSGGGGAGGGGESEIYTVHVNTITDVRPYESVGGAAQVVKVSTSGLDGKVVVWDVSNVTPIGGGGLVGKMGGMSLR